MIDDEQSNEQETPSESLPEPSLGEQTLTPMDLDEDPYESTQQDTKEVKKEKEVKMEVEKEKEREKEPQSKAGANLCQHPQPTETPL